MSTDKKSSFVAYLKKSPLSLVVQALSLLSLLMSVVLAVLTNLRVAVIVLSVFGSVLLIMYNRWIARATQPSVIDPSTRLPLYRKRFRVWVHSISACLLVLCWIIVACMVSNRCGGHVLFRLKCYELAAEKLELYLEKPRNDYRAYYELAHCYKNLGNPKKYVETLERLLEQKPIFEQMEPKERNEEESKINAEIALALVSSNYIEGIDNQYEKAQAHIEDARRLDPNWPEIHWIQGFITASEAGDEPSRFERAKTNVENSFADSESTIKKMKLPEKSREYRSYFSQHHYWFGRALSELGDYERAKNELIAGLDIAIKDRRLSDSLQGFYFRLGQNEYRSTEDIESARRYWQYILEKDYLGRKLLLDGLSYWRRAREARDNLDQEKFQEYFDRALDTLSKAERSGLRTQQLYLALGVLYFEKKDYVNAEANFERASEEDPSSYLTFYWLGRSKFNADKIDQGKEAMTRAKQLEPESADVRYWLGRILYKEGDTVGALEEFETSIELDDKNPEVYKWCIACLYTISQKKDRYSDERVALLNKALGYVNKALGYVNSGIKVSQSQNDESALKAIRDWKHVVLNCLAYIYAERGENFALAKAYIDEALEIAKAQEPKAYPYYLDTKAWVIIKRTERNADLSKEQKLSNYMEAEKLLNECLKSLPSDSTNARADVLFHLGYLEKLRGNETRAQEYFLECLKLNPEHSGARKELK
jgi:tetratricopeptide (TPR) repeat protein